MSAYQKLKEFQDEVERLTGSRPDCYITFNTRGTTLSEDDCRLVRDCLVMDSGGELRETEMDLDNPDLGKWTAFKGQDHFNRIEVTIHGPCSKEEKVCGA